MEEIKKKLKCLQGGKLDSSPNVYIRRDVKTGKPVQLILTPSDLEMVGLRQNINAAIKSFLSLVALVVLTLISFIFILALMLSLVGCGPTEASIKYGTTADVLSKPNPIELVMYYTMFLEEAHRRDVDLSNKPVPVFYFTKIEQGDPNSPYKTAGVCDGKKIFIDTEQFYAVSKMSREVLMMHEMGHCILKRDHNEKCLAMDDKKECVKSGSIMRGRFIRSITPYYEMREYYLDELFFGR